MERIGKSPLRFRLRLGAAILAAGAAVLPATALAAPAKTPAKTPALGAVAPGPLIAVTEVDPATGHNKVYPVKPGEIGHTVIGVANIDDAPVNGAGVGIRVLDDLYFAKKYNNCWYADDANAHQAWCTIDHQLAPNASYALAEDFVAARRDARADKVTSVVFQWHTKEWMDAHGGAQGLAESDALPGTGATPGTDGVLSVEPEQLAVPATQNSINFAYLKLDVPAATPTPTGTPTPAGTPTATPTGAAAPGSGGGLPITGSGVAPVAAAGGAMLVLGGAGYLIALRRRTRFVA